MMYSHSSLKQYETCPAAFKYFRIDKISVQEDAAAANRGKELHAEIEDYLKGGLPILSGTLHYLYPKLDKFKSIGAESEVPFAIKRDWSICDFDDPDAYLRGVIDMLAVEEDVALVLDWKSGKKRDYFDQLKLYSAIVFTLRPEVQSIIPMISYLDQRCDETYDVIYRSSHEELKAWVDAKTATIEKDKIYAANPSFGCRYCGFGKGRGGPCKWG